MFKTNQLLRHAASFPNSSKMIPATKCPLNKTARNLYLTYITIAVSAPFLYSYIYTDRNTYKKFYIVDTENETCENYSKKKTQHNVRYIF